MFGSIGSYNAKVLKDIQPEFYAENSEFREKDGGLIPFFKKKKKKKQK
jgi:hypothetical protein